MSPSAPPSSSAAGRSSPAPASAALGAAAPAAHNADRSNARTTLVVRLGLIVLALIGVISVFGEPLLGLGAANADLGAASPSGDQAAAPAPAPPSGH